MTIEEHCAECIEQLGKPFREVHEWLDEFVGTPEYGMKHRKVRHHEEGIRQVDKIFGKEAAKAARLHIISDLKMEGWDEKEHRFPQNESHYVDMGLFMFLLIFFIKSI